MPAQRIRWQGPTRLRAIHGATEALVQEWQRNWAIVPAAVAVSGLSRSRIQAPAWQFATSSGGGRVLAGLDQAATARLGGALAGMPTGVDADFNVSLSVGEDAVAALLSALTGSAVKRLEHAEMPVEVMSDRYGWICMEVCVGDLGFCLLLDPVLCDRLDPVRAATGTLQKRSAALGQTTVALTATLELGSVDISLVSSLRPGDILNTGIPLAAPVALGVATGPAVVSGRLSIIDQNKAITATIIH